MKRLAILLTLVIAFSTSVRAQESITDHRAQQIREALQEKLKVDLRTLGTGSHRIKNDAGSKPNAAPFSGGQMTLGVNEKGVSTISTPESEVHAAINPTDTNNIVVSPMQNVSTISMPIYYTKDFGKSWKKSLFKALPYETGAYVVGGGDPLFAYDANGKLYMSWIDLYTNASFDSLCAGMYWAYSTDGGQNWIRPNNGYIGASRGMLNLQTGPDTSFTLDDKEWLAVDRSQSAYRGTLYAAWTHIARSGYGVFVRRKLPQADSMEAPVLVSKGNYKDVQYTSIGIDANGYVHVTFLGSLDGANLSLYHAYSTDGGASFKPEEVISHADIPGSSVDATEDTIYGLRRPGNYPCPHVAIDTAVTGNIYMVWNAFGVESDEGHGADIYFAKWDPATRKWLAPIVLNNDKHESPIDHFYPSIAVNSRGVITVTWYDRREDPDNNVNARLYMAQSFDHGATWTNVPVASQATDFSTVGDQNGGFGIGEYNQVLTTSGYAIPIWADGRKGTGDLDVFAAFIPIDPNMAVPTRTARVTSDIQIYPTPAASIVRLNCDIPESSAGSITVVNQLGQVVSTVATGSLSAGEHSYDVSVRGLPNGTYYLVIRTASGTEEASFVVNH